MRTLKVAGLAGGILLLASPVFAQTNPDIQAQIQVLLAQIQVLKAQLNPQSQLSSQPDDYGMISFGNSCPKLSITMQRGARDVSYDGQVSELQKFISDYYDIDPEEIVTGFFGRITQGYVQQFQRAQGLPSFGIAGSLTRAAIARVCANSSTNSSSSVTPTITTPTITTSDRPVMRSCPFNNTEIASGASVTAYRFNQVSPGGIGGTCNDYTEIRVCNNGVLSGSYTNTDCRNISSPSTTSSESKCTFTSDSDDKENQLTSNTYDGTFNGCGNLCTISRNEKWGYGGTGWCHYTGTNGVVQMQFIPTAPFPDVDFTVTSSPTSITLAVGQSATDGPNGIRITLQNVQDAYDWSGGVPKVSLMVKVSSAPNTGYYLSSSGETLGFADSTSPTGTIDLTISSISLQGKTVILQIVAHTYPET